MPRKVGVKYLGAIWPGLGLYLFCLWHYGMIVRERSSFLLKPRSGTASGCCFVSDFFTEGLRFASTSGYFLTNLRVAAGTWRRESILLR